MWKLTAIIWFAICAGYAQPPASLIAEFQERKGILVQTIFVRSDTSRTTITSDILLINDFFDTVRGRIRIPNVDHGEYPVAVLVVGIETGRDVVGMIEGHDSVIVAGIDYPYKGPVDLSGWNSLNAAFALRETGFATVPQILLFLDWLFRHPRADTTDVTMIAVSFGVFTATPAAAIDRRVRRFVVVQAGGDLTDIIATQSKRLDVPMPSWLAGWFGSWILLPFEPNRYIGALSPRPVLIVSGESDEFFSHASVESLFDHANEPKEWIQHRHPHVVPGEEELILELTNLVAERLYGRR